MNRTTRHHGQALVEMAVLLPLLLMMFLAMFDFSLAFTANVQLRNAVAEGGYYAAQNPGDLAGVRSQIRNELSTMATTVTDADITITPCVNATTGYETEIQVRYRHPMIFGLFAAGPTLELRNDTTVPQFGGCR